MAEGWEPAVADLPPATAGRLRSVRRLLRRKHRLAGGEFLAEGPQAVREALRFGRAREMYAAPGLRTGELLAAAREAGVPAYAVSEAELGQLTDTVHPQGVVAVCTLPGTDMEQVLEGIRLGVVCAQVRDPGNAGTVIRCADAFGADAALLTADSVELTNPKVIRASAGSVFHLPLVAGVELPATVAALRRHDVQILAADGSGPERLDRLERAGDLARPTVWLMGNEAWGLAPEHAALADRRVAVPLWGAAESLNLATAAAICLYATASAQRRTEAGHAAGQSSG